MGELRRKSIFPYSQDQAEKEAARAALFNPEGACTALMVGSRTWRSHLTIPYILLFVVSTRIKVLVFLFFLFPSVFSMREAIEVHYAPAKIEAAAVGEGRMVKTSDGSFTVADIWWGEGAIL